MLIKLIQDEIQNVSADGLVLPCDGDICVVGGTAAAKALKASFAAETENREEQMEMYAFCEDEIKRLGPIPHGQARVIEGNETWKLLVVIAVQPHHVNDVIFSQDQYGALLKSGISRGVIEATRQGAKSLALTLVSTSYRLTPEISIRSIAAGLAENHREDVAVNWCIRDDHHLALAQKCCGYLGLPLEANSNKLEISQKKIPSAS